VDAAPPDHLLLLGRLAGSGLLIRIGRLLLDVHVHLGTFGARRCRLPRALLQISGNSLALFLGSILFRHEASLVACGLVVPSLATNLHIDNWHSVD
jgi:hypothetical protein